MCKKCEATVVLDNDLAGKRVVSLGDASAGVRTKATSLSPVGTSRGDCIGTVSVCVMPV